MTFAALIPYFCLLTASLFAEPLARDNAEAIWNDVYGDVSIDALYYDNKEPGVAYLRGSVELVNYDSEVNNAFDWGFRLEILRYGFDEKLTDHGNIKDNGNTFNRSETISLHVDRTHAPRKERHTMRGTVWLNVKHPRRWNQSNDALHVP